MSDNTTDITDNGNDIGNSNSSNVYNCKNDKNIVVNNASSSHDNNSNIICNKLLTVVQFLLIMFHLTLMTKLIKSITMTIIP